MLKISPAVSVADVPGPFAKKYSYILYPDSERKDLYYALADKPTFDATEDGSPAFNLSWYFGGGAKPGGICTLTVALPVPDVNKSEVRDAIVAVLTSDQSTKKIAQSTFDLCKAMDAKDAAKVAALKAELGFNDDAANKKKALFIASQPWQQFLPARGNLEVAPISFKTGTVTVEAFKNDQAYAAGSPGATSGKISTTPSLFNKNAAVVTFSLEEFGANLFWHGFGGTQFDATKRPPGYDEADRGVSFVTVTYNVTFDGLLPEAKATVTLSQKVFAKLDVETQVKSGSWGRIYREDVVRGKEYDAAVNNATEIVLPGGGTETEKAAVQKLLTDWAAAQLIDMAKLQLPAVKLEDLNVDNVRSLNTLSQQSRTYKLTQAVTIPKNPQAQLLKLNDVKGSAPLGNFFHVINLNDRPYFDVDMTVRPPNLSRLAERSVERFVVTKLTYAGLKLRGAENKEVSTLEYVAARTPAQQTPAQTLKGTFDAREPNKSLEYSYLVAYADGTPSLPVGPIKQSGSDNYLDLGSVDIGVLSVSLNPIDLPWGIISGAKVDLKYGDWEKSVTLKTSETPALVVKPFGRAITETLKYKVTLNLTAGAPQVGPEIEVTPVRGHAEFTLKNPLGDMVNSILFQLDAAVDKAQLRVEYTLKSDGPDLVFKQLVQLDKSKPETTTFSWKVPVFSKFPSSLRVAKARVGAKDLTDLSSGVFDPLEQDVAITVQSDGFSSF